MPAEEVKLAETKALLLWAILSSLRTTHLSIRLTKHTRRRYSIDSSISEPSKQTVERRSRIGFFSFNYLSRKDEVA